MYRCYQTKVKIRMKMARGGTRGKSSGGFMRECITGVLGPGTAAIDAHSATTSLMMRIKVFWHMQEDGLLAPSKRSMLTGWSTASTWRSFGIVPACEMRCGIELYMYAWACLMTVELCLCTCTLIINVWVCLVYVYLCLTVGYGCNQFGWWNLPPSLFIGPLCNLC